MGGREGRGIKGGGGKEGKRVEGREQGGREGGKGERTLINQGGKPLFSLSLNTKDSIFKLELQIRVLLVYHNES